MQIIVKAPLKTREVLQLLRDWEPVKGVKYTLAKRKSFILLFDVSTVSAIEARTLAEKRLKEAGLTELPGFSINVV